MGTSHHDARQSTGATSNVMSTPNPIVTADVAIGSISPVSSRLPPRRAAATASEATTPTTTATAVAATVVRSDVSTDASGATPVDTPGLISDRPSARQADSERP